MSITSATLGLTGKGTGSRSERVSNFDTICQKVFLILTSRSGDRKAPSYMHENISPFLKGVRKENGCVPPAYHLCQLRTVTSLEGWGLISVTLLLLLDFASHTATQNWRDFKLTDRISEIDNFSLSSSVTEHDSMQPAVRLCGSAQMGWGLHSQGSETLVHVQPWNSVRRKMNIRT